MFKLDSDKKIEFATKLLYAFFQFEKHFFTLKPHNYPAQNCVLALWHAHQFALYNFVDKANLSVMISRSRDGEFIARATEMMGIKTVRGSKGKSGAIEATLAMVERLKAGESAAITVDGPRGPKGVVKEGIIKIAKKASVPIVPLIWYSPNITFLKFNSWDEFRVPVLWCKAVACYGEPIWVEGDEETCRKQVEDALFALYEGADSVWRNIFCKNKSKQNKRID